MDQDLLNSIATPMNLIVPKLYIGHLGAALDLDLLNSMQISHIVQVFEDDLRPFDMIYHSIVIEDDPNVDLIPYLQPSSSLSNGYKQKCKYSHRMDDAQIQIDVR